MRRLILAILTLFAFWVARAQPAGRHTGLDFVANGGQWPAEVRYRAALPGGAVFLTHSGFVYSYYDIPAVHRAHDLSHDSGRTPLQTSKERIGMHAYRVIFAGANPKAADRPAGKCSNYYNFFLGSDPGKWAGAAPAFERAAYGQIYNGIDLQVYGQEKSLKYDFVVSPGADPAQIRLRFEGVIPELTAAGDLSIRTSVNEIIEKAPVAYQVVSGKRKPVACSYRLDGQTLSFAFPQGFDRRISLVIDPLLVFATYSGSTSVTFGWSATGDASGNLYAGGQSMGTGWPVTMGASQTSFGGLIDACVNKYSSNGSTLIYSTYYGGDSADYPNTMFVNRFGELIMAGTTRSHNIPLSAGCFDNTHNGGSDIYVVRFNAAGSGIRAATYLGGAGQEGDISTATSPTPNRGEVIADSAGNIFVAFGTNSLNFPTSATAFQKTRNGPSDAFIASFDSSCSTLRFSTYLGGSGDDAAVCLQAGPAGRIVVGGGTTSPNFPGLSAAWQRNNSGNTDGFIAVLDSSGSSILGATYIGTTAVDDVSKLQVDREGNVYATGICGSGLFPVSSNVYHDSAARDYIIKLDSLLTTRILSTAIGGDVTVNPTAFLVDRCGNIYFVGYGGNSAVLPLTPDALQRAYGGFWLAAMNPDMSALRYASYFGSSGDHIDGGSSRLDPDGIVYHSVCTNGNGIPTNSSSWSPTRRTGGLDIASWKFAFQLSGMRAGIGAIPDSVCAPAVLSLRNTTVGANRYSWEFGDGSPRSSLYHPAPHRYERPGRYTIRMYAYAPAGCNPVDSAIRTFEVFGRDTVKFGPVQTKTCGTRDSVRVRVKPSWTISVLPEKHVRYQKTGGEEIVLFADTPVSYVIVATNPGPCHVPASDTLRFTLIRDTTQIARVNPMTDTLLCNRDTAIYRLPHKLKRLQIVPGGYTSVSPDSLTLRFFPPQTSSYRIFATSFNRCDTLYDTVSFTIRKARVEAAFELSPKITDQTLREFTLSNRSKDAAAYEWTVNGEFMSVQRHPVFMPEDTGTYCFTLVSSNDFCRDTARDCGRLIETHIYMPNAFTPNGDGLNDHFGPLHNNTAILEFSVYNRYGQRVFVSYNDRHRWDGTFKGKRCDMGTYFYKLLYQILDREPALLKGDVTLLR